MKLTNIQQTCTTQYGCVSYYVRTPSLRKGTLCAVYHWYIRTPKPEKGNLHVMHHGYVSTPTLREETLCVIHHGYVGTPTLQGINSVSYIICVSAHPHFRKKTPMYCTSWVCQHTHTSGKKLYMLHAVDVGSNALC